MAMMKERMTRKLAEALAPTLLNVIDESEKHHGHAGWREGGETHFRIEIVSPVFAGKSRLDRHRAVNAVVAEELRERVHALALVLRAPDEV